MDPEIRNFSSEGIFCHALLKFIRSAASKTYRINDPIGLKREGMPHLGSSHLLEQKF